MPRFSVAIVNWNGGDYVQGALSSLANQTFRDFEVLLIDNSSTDGSIDDLDAGGLPSFSLMAQTRNLGFAEGNNVAARAANGEWLILLNPDAEAQRDWLEQIDAAIKTFPDVRMFASAQYSLHDPALLDGAGDCYLFFGVPWRGGFLRPASELPSIGECFSPCGAGAIYHRRTFLDHGGFDERFFCFCEDVDLGYRMRLAGETCVFLPEAVIHHAGGGLSGRASVFALKHGARNRLWTYLKCTPAPLLFATAPLHIGATILILLRGLVTGRASATWAGIVEGLKDWPRIARHSTYAAPKRKVSYAELLRAMAWNPLRLLDRRPVVRDISNPE